MASPRGRSRSADRARLIAQGYDLPVARLSERPLDTPHPSRLPASAPGYPLLLQLHRAALEAGLDCYLDPQSGRLVLTAARLAANGRCCGLGCRHCPFVK